MQALVPEKEWRASAPCRADLGGTLDLPVFYHTLGRGAASTFNMALTLRTELVLKPFERGKTKVSSKGFSSAVFPNGEAPYDHPMGLVFAMLDAFGARDLSLEIHSASPPRSSLGGSSALAVALVALLMGMAGEVFPDGLGEDEREAVVLRAWNLESAITRVPGGMQDYLAAAFGGVNQWVWQGGGAFLPWQREKLLLEKDHEKFSSSVLLAYGGDPHDSIHSNERSIRCYLSGESRKEWQKIACLSKAFGRAISKGNLEEAISCMNKELDMRLHLTPDILDSAGMALVGAARSLSCGARFTGAGGGGCVWALGPEKNMIALRKKWEEVVRAFPGASVLDARPEREGVRLSCKDLA